MKKTAPIRMGVSLLRCGNSTTVASLILSSFFVSGCHARKDTLPSGIEFTKIPPAAEGGRERIDTIAGRVNGARPGQKIVVYAKSGMWWVQPTPEHALISIQPDSTWGTETHLGFEYAALLVEPGYRPPPTLNADPKQGGAVASVEIVKGVGQATLAPTKPLRFSGYDWKVRTIASDRGGVNNPYDPDNVWTDKSGALHLRIAKKSDRWNCAELNLNRSLGYGTYRFVVRDSSLREPAAVFSMFTWDDSDVEQSHREFGVELTRWGDPQNKNAQFTVQPYYVPANVSRFVVASGRITYAVRWQPGNLSFRAVQGTGTAGQRVLAEHSFTSGIPTPGNESVHMNLYIFGNSQVPIKEQTEVVIEKFEYLP
jgi:hypothetical protein